MVKSCSVDANASLAELGASGVVDERFAPLSEGAAFPIDVVHHDGLGHMRALLLGDMR